MPSLLATSGTEVPAASSASAWRSLRTICSGVCLFFNFESPPSTHLGRSDSHSSWISLRGADQGPDDHELNGTGAVHQPTPYTFYKLKLLTIVFLQMSQNSSAIHWGLLMS